MTLALIHPRLEQQLLLAKKVQLIDGLKVSVHGMDHWLSKIVLLLSQPVLLPAKKVQLIGGLEVSLDSCCPNLSCCCPNLSC